MEEAIRAVGRTARQRTTLYGVPDPTRTRLSFGAEAIVEPRNPSVNDARLEAPRRLVRPGLVGARAS